MLGECLRFPPALRRPCAAPGPERVGGVAFQSHRVGAAHASAALMGAARVPSGAAPMSAGPTQSAQERGWPLTLTLTGPVGRATGSRGRRWGPKLEPL